MYVCVYTYIYIYIYIYIYWYVFSLGARERARIPHQLVRTFTLIGWSYSISSGRFPMDMRTPPLEVKILHSYICISLSLCMYIYIYIYLHMYTYIYIYIYILLESSPLKSRTLVRRLAVVRSQHTY